MKIVLPWLRDFVAAPGDADSVAHEIALRGFEVASVEPGENAVIDFEITANRPDAMSHIGIAREAAAIWQLPLTPPAASALRAGTSADLPGGGSAELNVRLEAPDLCPR